MKINLRQLGKKYNNEWIFKNITLELSLGNHYVILGGNGSGKSTLLQTISGFQIQSEGTLEYMFDGKSVSVENIFKHISIASPYMELIEDFTLQELIDYQAKFKAFSEKNIAEVMQLESAKNKAIKYYSSGMKQRVKLGLAILSNSPVLLLDEPLSNIDKNGAEWYRNMIKKYSSNRIIIVCSNNQKEEFEFCNESIFMENYKG
jgi:ABC-type multidrug transport system ATPase subunit